MKNGEEGQMTGNASVGNAMLISRIFSPKAVSIQCRLWRAALFIYLFKWLGEDTHVGDCKQYTVSGLFY